MTAEGREATIPGCDVILPPSSSSLRSLMNHPSTTCISSTDDTNDSLGPDQEHVEPTQQPEQMKGHGDSCSSLSSNDEHDDDASTVILKPGSPGGHSIGTSSTFNYNNDGAGNNKDAPEISDMALTSASHSIATSADVSAYKAHIQTLQNRLATSQAALRDSDQQMQQAQDQILDLTKTCTDLEAAMLQSTSTNEPHRDMVEKLRAKNAALVEQCSLLQTMSDKDAIIIRDLRASNAQLCQQKMEMEVDFCNQLSTLSATIESTEDDHAEQLKAKEETIASLKVHIKNQDNNLLQLQEEVYELKEEILNRTKRMESSSSGESSSVNATQEPSSKVLILEQEKRLLLERVAFLTLNRVSLTEEVDELRDRVADLSTLEYKVVPQLKKQLEAAREALQSLEHDVQIIVDNHANTIEQMQKALRASEVEKKQLEEDFCQQIIQLNTQKKSIVRDYQSENEGKDIHIGKLEQQIASLRERILQLESQSELEEISGREEVERLLQMNMVTEEKLSEQDAIIQELRFSIREEKKINASLEKALKKYLK